MNYFEKKIKKALQNDPYLRKHSLLKNILFNKIYPSLSFEDYQQSEFWIPLAIQEIIQKKEIFDLNAEEDFSKQNLWGNIKDIGPVG